MDKELKKLLALLDHAEIEDALKHAESMKDKRGASEMLSDYAVALIRHRYDYDTGELLLKKAVAINPKDAEAYFNLGVMYTDRALLLRQAEKFSLAEDAYLKAVKLKPDYMEAHFNLALFYHFLGRNDEADLEYAVFAELSESPEITESLKKILSKKVKKTELRRILEGRASAEAP
jgi:Flp pilus assembly protein TadD